MPLNFRPSPVVSPASPLAAASFWHLAARVDERACWVSAANPGKGGGGW